jgi:hypothetical protein
MAQPVHRGQAAALRGRWLWLFPASYALHIAEEGLAGERFFRSRRLLPRGAWRRGIVAGALILGSVPLVALPLSHPSTAAGPGA